MSIVNSDGVNGSNGVNRSYGVSWSDGVNRSYGVCNCLFITNKRGVFEVIAGMGRRDVHRDNRDRSR